MFSQQIIRGITMGFSTEKDDVDNADDDEKDALFGMGE